MWLRKPALPRRSPGYEPGEILTSPFRYKWHMVLICQQDIRIRSYAPAADLPSAVKAIILAEVPGFEPGNDGIKTRCLAAWLYPYIAAISI
jgi:hypothetical protein